MITKIQSVSDLITNSSTEVFLTYEKSVADDIRNLVTSVLSLVDPSKTFDDYFTIEMNINYDDLEYILDDFIDDIGSYEEDFPWLEQYRDCEDSQKFMETLSVDTIEKVFDIYDRLGDSYECPRYMYEGYRVTAKVEDPVIRKVQTVLNGIDDIFGVDYYSNW